MKLITFSPFHFSQFRCVIYSNKRPPVLPQDTCNSLSTHRQFIVWTLVSSFELELKLIANNVSFKAYFQNLFQYLLKKLNVWRRDQTSKGTSSCYEFGCMLKPLTPLINVQHTYEMNFKNASISLHPITHRKPWLMFNTSTPFVVLNCEHYFYVQILFLKCCNTPFI